MPKLLKIILPDERYIPPFNERARALRILNKPLWLSQRDVLAPYISREMEFRSWNTIPESREPCPVHRDNLYFDAAYIEAFLEEAQKQKDEEDPGFRN